MNNLILHSLTRAEVERFTARPSHALVIVGPDGIGKTALAEAMVAAVLQTSLASHPYHLFVRPGASGSISIDSIRELQKFLQLKTTGQKPFRRSAIVEYAHGMTTEAQNAFLKLLEEPPSDTLLILTANSPRALLPTILSRCQTLTIRVPEDEQLQSLLAKSAKSEEARRQAFFLSGGLPGLLSALLDDDEGHPLLASVTTAKEILRKEPFERLAMADSLSRQRELAIGVVDSLERIAQAGLSGAAANRDDRRLRQWHKVRKAAIEAKNSLERSVNAKLVLTNLFISL